MRIARVLTRLNLGGPARQALASDPLLAARGHALRLFAGHPAPGEGDLFETFRARGIDVVRVPGLGRRLAPLGDLRALATLRRELAAFAPDVVHTHASKAGALGRRAARGLAAASVHTFHGHVLEGYFHPALARGLVLWERRLARDTARVVAVSHATADDLVRLGVVDERKLVVVPPGIDLEPFLALPGPPVRPSSGPAAGMVPPEPGSLRARIGAAPDVYLVGVVGRLVEVKRPALALDVFDLLAARYPRLELVFVGDGPERRMLERRIGALGERGRRIGALGERVHLLGVEPDMPRVLSDLDCVLATSRSEGLPVALIEAGAAGRPVVATDVGGVAELVVHERTGLLGREPDELAFHLAALLDAPGLGAELGHRARLRVAKRHAAAALADRLEELYRVVIEERACAS